MGKEDSHARIKAQNPQKRVFRFLLVGPDPVGISPIPRRSESGTSRRQRGMWGVCCFSNLHNTQYAINQLESQKALLPVLKVFAIWKHACCQTLVFLTVLDPTHIRK